MDKQNNYMLERSRTDLLIKRVLDEAVDQFKVRYQKRRGKHSGGVTGTLDRDDTTGKVRGGGVDIDYESPGGHQVTIGWSRNMPQTPAPASPAPASPAPAPASPAPASPPTATPKKSKKKKAAGGLPAAPTGSGRKKKATPPASGGTPPASGGGGGRPRAGRAPAGGRGRGRKARGARSSGSTPSAAPPASGSPAQAQPAGGPQAGPQVRVSTATVQGTVRTGIGSASRLRAAAKRRVRALAMARQAVRSTVDRAKANQNIFAGARSSALPSVTPPNQPKPETRAQRFGRRAATLAGIAAIAAAARHL